jgi:glutamate synthase (NADPH/NADH) small chain
LHCADPKCIQACPLHIDIRSFIDRLTESDFVRALETIQERNPFPSICGRVCQHERFCERACLLGAKRQPVAIGALERAAAEFGKAVSRCRTRTEAWCGRRVALAGSGPASLIAAHDLAAKGYRVTVLEALHEAGGVLIYGIPPFRLPREVVRREIEALRSLGVEFRTDFLVGKTCSIEELFAQGYDAVFLGTGAGLPKLMNIPGEDLAGVYTANEFLTRLNLMEAYRFPESDTPVRVGKQTVVVGGGNSAIDAARWARRMGSETTVMFRRGREQLRARKEEIAHAEEEGVKFDFLAQPVRLEGDERGVLCRMQGIRMRLEGEEDSARPFAVPISGSEFWVNLDTVIAAVGQGPNPTIQHTLPSLVTRDGMIAITPTGETNVPDVYAGGDVTRGGSTIIEALRDGRAAAEAIGRALRGRRGVCRKDLPLQSTPPFRILSQRELAPAIISIEIEAADIANHWQPGQFVIVRPTVTSERIPLTLVDGDMLRGTIRLVFQIVGKTTSVLAGLRPGQAVAGVLGPLGKGATIGHFGSVLCVAGGVGVAEVLPVARALRRAGNYVSVLAGARSAERQILRDELARSADEVHWATDDGSDGFHGTVLALMRNLYSLRPPAFVHVIGPVPLMRGAAAMTQEWNVPTVASLNPIMLDGTGMCGGCRVSVGGRQLFACLDGPEFDAHQVDFEQLAGRNRAYLTEEKLASCPSPCPNHDASG